MTPDPDACPECGELYEFAEERTSRDEVTVHCLTCGHTWTVPDEMEEPDDLRLDDPAVSREGRFAPLDADDLDERGDR